MLSSLILCNNSKPFLDWMVTCDKKWIAYNCDDQLSGWTEKFQSISQSQTCTQERVMVTGCLLPVWSTTAFWILAKSLYMRSVLSKSMRCTKNCNACSQHWSKERDQFSETMPNCTLHKQNFKSWMNKPTKFCLTGHIHVTSCNRLPLLQATQQLHAGKMLSQSAGCRKCFSRVHWLLKHRFFSFLKHSFLCYRNQQTYFSLAKMCFL